MKDAKSQSGVDKGLIAMFLKMSVEERLLANDNAVIAIQELRSGFRQRMQFHNEILVNEE